MSILSPPAPYLTALKVALVVAVIGGLGFLVWQDRARGKELAEMRTADAALRLQFDDLSKREQQLDATLAEKARTESAQRIKRAHTDNRVEQAAHDDPATADFLDAPLPDGLRRAYLGDQASGPADPGAH